LINEIDIVDPQVSTTLTSIASCYVANTAEGIAVATNNISVAVESMVKVLVS